MSIVKTWTIRQNRERYGNESFETYGHGRIVAPHTVTVEGTLAQAQWVRDTLSDRWAGCDFYYFIEGEDD